MMRYRLVLLEHQRFHRTILPIDVAKLFEHNSLLFVYSVEQMHGIKTENCNLGTIKENTYKTSFLRRKKLLLTSKLTRAAVHRADGRNETPLLDIRYAIANQKNIPRYSGANLYKFIYLRT